MDKKKTTAYIFIGVFLLCFFSFTWSWWVTRGVRSDATRDSMKNQSVAVNSLVLTETKNKKKYWQIYSDRAEYDSSKSQVTMYGLIGNFYNSDEEVVLSFESPKGMYSDETKKIVLLGETLIVTKDNSSVRADKFEWVGNTDEIKASGNVIINRNNDIITKSEKAIFNTDLTNFKIIGKTKSDIYSDDNNNNQYSSFKGKKENKNSNTKKMGFFI